VIQSENRRSKSEARKKSEYRDPKVASAEPLRWRISGSGCKADFDFQILKFGFNSNWKKKYPGATPVPL